jgi:hypothetical protein
MRVMALEGWSPLWGREKKNSMAKALALLSISWCTKLAPSIATLLLEDQMHQQKIGKTSFHRMEEWKDVTKLELDHFFNHPFKFKLEKNFEGRDELMFSHKRLTKEQSQRACSRLSGSFLHKRKKLI